MSSSAGGYASELRVANAPAEKALVSIAPTSMLSADATTPIRTEALTRHYGSLKLLEGISIEGRARELLSIVGPNGAGKTTLMRCLSDGMERSVKGYDCPIRCSRDSIKGRYGVTP